MNQKGSPREAGQAQVLILGGIVLFLAVAGGIFFLGRVTAPKPPASQRGEQAPVVTPQPSPLSTEAPAKMEDLTANWKTYTNTKYGFSIKYPPVFEEEDHSQQFPPFTIFLGDRSRNIDNPPSITIAAEASNLSLEEYINKKSWNVGEKMIASQNEFTTAYKRSGAGGGPDYYLIRKGDYIITISRYLYETEVILFNQILSTFKFTN